MINLKKKIFRIKIWRNYSNGFSDNPKPTGKIPFIVKNFQNGFRILNDRIAA
jgi:hypothetical protein